MLRLLLPFMAGIVLQWYAQWTPAFFISTALLSLLVICCFFFIPFFHRYQLSFANGVATAVLFISAGGLLTFQKDIRHDKKWFGHIYKSNSALLITLDEPLSEKTNSLKATARVSSIISGNQLIPVTGNIILYFRKDMPHFFLQTAGYGTQLIIRRPLQEIINSGNPGGFDYKRYCLFQAITHQVYLDENDFELLGSKKRTAWKSLLYAAQEKLLAVFRRYINGAKETGLAEALLIGYKNDLDRSLVQSYSNTGVVHIIAISGLHLGLIYWLLTLLLSPLRKRKKWKWLPPLLVIAGLWLFSLLAGGQPSVLRSALMFTCLVCGESLGRKTTIYNTLALSAFLLLCYNPFWLWDVGFQLSYAALLSIVLFMKPVYRLLYCKNKWVDIAWKMNAVTLAAQVLTLPFCVYYFHQFPNYFLLTNFIAVPLSSLILLGEIFLCLVAFIPPVAALAGIAVSWLIKLMNGIVETIESFPFALWDGLQVSIAQSFLLLFLIAAIGYGVVRRSAAGIRSGLLAMLAFTLLRSMSFIQTGRQQKIIVYNIPRKTAIDLVDGRHYTFAGDPFVQEDDFTRNFHLRPSRILHRSSPAALHTFIISGNHITHGGQHILLLDETVSYYPAPLQQFAGKEIIDLLVISKNPRLYITELVKTLVIKEVVFDASVPAWKMRYWKNDCDSLHIPWHDVSAKGAFVMNLR